MNLNWQVTWDFHSGPLAKTPCSQCLGVGGRGAGLIHGQRTRFHMLQLGVRMPQLKPSTAKEINKNKFIKNKENAVL